MWQTDNIGVFVVVGKARGSFHTEANLISLTTFSNFKLPLNYKNGMDYPFNLKKICFLFRGAQVRFRIYKWLINSLLSHPAAKIEMAHGI